MVSCLEPISTCKHSVSPDVVPALPIYQARICQYAEHHDFNSVVCYDAAVHTRIANNPDMHWDDQFPDKFNSFLGGKKYGTTAAPLCFVCNQTGHFAASCFLRSAYPNSFHTFPPNSQLPQEVSGAQSNAAQPPLVPLPIFVPKSKHHNSVASTTNMVNARLVVTQQPISVIGWTVEDLTQEEPGLHSLSLTSFQDTNTSSQVCKTPPHVCDKFN